MAATTWQDALLKRKRKSPYSHHHLSKGALRLLADIDIYGPGVSLCELAKYRQNVFFQKLQQSWWPTKWHDLLLDIYDVLDNFTVHVYKLVSCGYISFKMKDMPGDIREKVYSTTYSGRLRLKHNI